MKKKTLPTQEREKKGLCISKSEKPGAKAPGGDENNPSNTSEEKKKKNHTKGEIKRGDQK